MPTSWRNNFTSGVLDPKLHARNDLPQWRTGLKQGTNVLLTPHGGVRRRPGMKYYDTLAEQGRIARFRFNLEQQYLLHFQNERVDIYTADYGRITTVSTPYPTADLPELYLRAQTADTMVVFHEDYAPHRLLRGVLDPAGPIRTVAGTDLIRIIQDAHDLITGDFVGLSGLTDVGGVDADEFLNTNHEVFEVSGTVANALALRWVSAGLLELDIDYGANDTDFGFRVGDTIALKGFSALTGIPVSQINRTQTITGIKARISFTAGAGDTASSTTSGGGSLGEWKPTGAGAMIPLDPSPLRVTNGSGVVSMEIDYDDGAALIVGGTIELSGFATTGGIDAANINGTRTLTAVHSGVGTRLQFAVESSGSSSTQAALGTWKAANFVEAYTGENAASTATGGGANGRIWAFTSLAPNTARKVALENLPTFNFEDKDSPPPKNERQILTFSGFVSGDDYQLVISVPASAYPSGNGGPRGEGGPTTIRTEELRWDTTVENNAGVMQASINRNAYATDLVTVTYDSVASGGGDYVYVFEFQEPVPIDLVTVNRIHSANGLIDIVEDVEGGTREEDVISTTRGWPRGGIFFQRRLWMFGLKSRPSTILASNAENFFDFETGSALDSEGIDVTGEFDPIRHLVAERGLTMLTSGSEVEIAGGNEGAAITPGNIAFNVSSRYGSTSVVPISVGGRPMYVDSIGRNIRQFGASPDSPTGLAESSELSILSQFLIKDPVGMELWRNDDGDYLFVVNTDGTCAVLNMNQSQGVAGWTEVTTTGTILELAEVNSTLFATVERTVDGADVIFLEQFNYTRHTDACVLLALGASSTMTNLAHLETETVQVRADDMTMESQVVDGSGEVPVMSGDALIVSNNVEAGLAIPTPTVVPMPPQVSQFSSISKASVDLFESRGVFVNGYRLREMLPGEAIPVGAIPAITRLCPIQLRGYGDRQSVTITMPQPQPATIRAVEMEVV